VNKKFLWFLSLAVLLVALACNVVMGTATPVPPTDTPPPADTPTSEPTPTPEEEEPTPTQEPATDETPTPSDTGGGATVEVVNDSDMTICYVFISPSEATEWGDDWLGSEEVIAPGESRVFEMEPDIYDLLLQDCDGNDIEVLWEQNLTGDQVWTVTGELDFSLEPTFGEVELAANFSSDPYTVDLTSGGVIDVDLMDLDTSCTGYAAQAPDFRFTLSESLTGELRIFFVAAEEDADTTLIVSDPFGEWVCNDDADADTYDPMVVFTDAESGQYDLWVGSYEADAFVDGTLYITQQQYGPNNLP